MAIKFEKITAGMELLDIHGEQAGNTTMRRIGVWRVDVLEVDAEKRKALVRWNGNKAEWWFARNLQRLYVKVPPKMQERINRQRF